MREKIMKQYKMILVALLGLVLTACYNKFEMPEPVVIYNDESFAESNPDLVHISIAELKEPLKVYAKTRYSQKEQPATLYPEGDGVRVVFDESQRAITPGQAVVFYDGDIVVGGGTISAKP